MRKLLLTSSALIPALLFAGSLAAQSPLPQQEGNQRGASPSTQMPGGSGAGSAGRSEQPQSPGNARRMPDASGGEQRAQGNEPAMPRQKSGANTSEEMPKQGSAERNQQHKQMRDAQRPQDTQNRDAQRGPGDNEPRNAQRRPQEGAPNQQDAQRPETSGSRDAQRRQEGTASQQDAQRNKTGTSTEQRAGKEGSDVETTGSIDISAEKRTTIRETITREHVAPIRDVSFSVNVGVEVPRTVELRPLPSRVVEIVPQYRRYRYFVLADGRIVIVEPSSYKIVYIITA